MVNWFKTYRTGVNNRLGTYIVDFDCKEDLIFDDKISPLDQSIDLINYIVKNYNPPYNLFISGGVDSQAMLWAWLQSGHQFRAIHFDYGNDFNSHDREYIKKFLDKNNINIKIDIVNFDALSFIKSQELKEYAKKYDTVSPQILSHIKMTELVDGTCVFGGNFIEPNNDYIFNYTSMGIHRYSLSNFNIVPLFFSGSLNLAYAFYKTYKSTQKIRENQKVEYNAYTLKVDTFQQCNFPVIAQPKKFTGFEKIKESFDNLEVSPKTKLKYANQLSKRPFDLLYRYSLYDYIGYYFDKAEIKHHRDILAINK